MPRTADPERHIARIVELISEGVSAHVAAGTCGIPSSTHYRWVEKGEAGEDGYREYREAIARAQSEWLAAREKELTAYAVNVTDKGAVDAANLRFVLERRASDEYGKRIELKVRDDAIRQIILRLREGLDPGTFAQVLAVLDSEGGEGVQGDADGEPLH